MAIWLFKEDILLCSDDALASAGMTITGVCVSLAGLVVQMFEMARVMNYRTEFPAA